MLVGIRRAFSVLRDVYLETVRSKNMKVDEQQLEVVTIERRRFNVWSISNTTLRQPICCGSGQLTRSSFSQLRLQGHSRKKISEGRVIFFQGYLNDNFQQQVLQVWR